MKFEKQTRRVIYVPEDDIYRVTYDSLRKETRTPRDPKKHLVCASTAATFWGTADHNRHCLGCARTVKAAWDAGDRYLLDTDAARHSAELVSEISVIRPDENDICSALSDLLNAIAAVRLGTTTVDDFEILPLVRKTLETCQGIEGYSTWTDFSKRRRFMYELPRKYRTQVVYTLMSLYFKSGFYPILTSHQQHELLSLDRQPGFDGDIMYLDDCLRKITAYRFA